MTPDEVTQQIKSWDKNARDIQIVSTGATNIVGIAGHLVYRFPITDDGLAVQHYEAALYKKFDGKLAVPTPQFVRVYEQPKCMVITRLEGRHVGVAELAKLSLDELRPIIQQLLAFSISLNKLVTPKDVRQMEHACIPQQLRDRPWHDYLANHLKKARFPEQPWLETMAHEQYARWKQLVDASTLPQIVVHDDLNDQNMLFIGNKLSGVLDFGDATIGTIAQELRQLRRISKDAVRIAIDEYAAMTGIVIAFDEIEAWVVAQELAAYCRWRSRGQFTRPSFLRAQATLRQWFPDFQG